MRRALGLVLAAPLVLGGCASAPGDEVRAAVGDVTDAANAGSRTALEQEVDGLVEVVRAQSAELGAEQTDRLLALAEAVRASSAVLEDATPEEPVEEPSEQAPEPEPSTEEPEPEPEEPEPEPEEPEPEPSTEEPEPEPEPSLPVEVPLPDGEVEQEPEDADEGGKGQGKGKGRGKD